MRESMGLFEQIGRQVEQFRQTAKETAAANADYHCRACEARFDTHEVQCPDCGAEEITPTETWE